MRFLPLHSIVLGLLILPLSACTHTVVPTPQDPGRMESSLEGDTFSSASSWQKTWRQLSVKLQKDGLDKNFTRDVFARLDMPPSPVPMGIKVKELYTNAFIPRPKARPPKSFETKLGIPGPWFKGVVTTKNAKLCREFMNKHAVAFARAELNYGVPSEVAAALLFVETRLGGYLGKHNAFYMLASMAVTRSPEAIPEYTAKLAGADQHLPWIRGKMELKADWAYKELKALLAYCHANRIDPLKVKGSVYGAIGLCQFMPSNISRYGVDGNGDGIIDLFQVDDAVSSLSNYLRRNGWKSGLSVQRQTRVLRTYNAMDIYAHTILALAKTIRQLP
ncbi:lytic murein transglycosylase [Mailhella massiliensis]|uniref:lytic murein transglycosylase n=1 Tax=Mailhella massiliensis TaxID=1903261 RepID=UPI0023EFA1F7|nr:lytic murein transglycosylase [Mailhella massiliensis]